MLFGLGLKEEIDGDESKRVLASPRAFEEFLSDLLVDGLAFDLPSLELGFRVSESK